MSGLSIEECGSKSASRWALGTGMARPGPRPPPELRHSFVSLLSSTGLSIEDISHLVSHANTRVTESVYRKELRPARGAGAMDALFPDSTALVSRLVSMALALRFQSRTPGL
jgi:integrase